MKETAITKEAAQQIAVELLKSKKRTEKVEVSTVELNSDVWVVRGTCPIDMEGHPWAEKFEVTLDTKGKVKSLDYGLL